MKYRAGVEYDDDGDVIMRGCRPLEEPYLSPIFSCDYVKYNILAYMQDYEVLMLHMSCKALHYWSSDRISQIQFGFASIISFTLVDYKRKKWPGKSTTAEMYVRDHLPRDCFRTFLLICRRTSRSISSTENLIAQGVQNGDELEIILR